MSFPLSSPAEVHHNGPVELKLTDETSGDPWSISTALDNTLSIKTTLGEVLKLAEDGTSETTVLALRNGVNRLSMAVDPGLSSDYTFTFPASGPTASGQLIGTSGASSIFYDSNPRNMVVVRLNPGPGEFDSVAAAIASIPVNPAPGYPTEDFPWVVRVYEGTYLEPNFVVPSYVIIVGIKQRAIKISPLALGGIFVTSEGTGGLAFVTITDTDPAYPAIQFRNCGNYSSLHKVNIENCEKGIRIITDVSATEDSIVSGSDIIIRDAFDYAISIETTSGTYGSKGYFSSMDIRGHSDSALLSTGVGSQLISEDCRVVGDGTGVGLTVSQGGYARLQAGYVGSTSTAIWTPSDGSTPTVLLSGMLYDNNTTNINIQEVNTIGRNEGYSRYTKTIYPKTSPFFIANKDYNLITVAAKGADFTSVAAAMASITGNSSTNRFTIWVGPGVFAEPQIVMKSYVTIMGIFQTQTTILATDPTKPLIIGTGYAAIYRLTLAGENPFFPPGVYPPYLIEYLGTADGTHFRVDQVILGTGVGLVHVGSTVGPAIYIQTECIVNQQSAITTGIYIEDSGPSNNPISFLIEGLVWVPRDGGLANFTKFLRVKSVAVSPSIQNIFGILTNATIGQRNAAPQGVGIELEGAVFNVFSDVKLGGMVTGLLVANSAETSILLAANLLMYFNTLDISLQSPSGQGTISGSASKDKISVVSGASYGITVNDSEGSIVLTGQLYQGSTWDRVTNITEQIQSSAALGVIDERPTLTPTGGLGLDVSAGRTYLFDGPVGDRYLKFIEFVGASLVLPDNTLTYIYVDSTGAILQSPSEPDYTTTTLLASAKTYGGNITYLQNVARKINALATLSDQSNREIFGVISISGCLATPGSNGSARAVAISSGVYYLGAIRYSPVSGDNITMTAYHGGTIETTITQIPLSWDDGGTLTALGMLEWAKHSIYLVASPETGVCNYFMVYSQQTYASLGAAQAGPLPVPPSSFVLNIMRVCSVVVSGMDPSSPLSAGRFIDERPTLQYTGSSLTSTLDHNSLLNLTVGNAHPQYFRVDGTSVMTGDIQLDGQNIVGTGGNLLNGVDLLAHANRHLPGGADPLTTGVPVSVGAANSAGVAASFARSDHVHNHGAQTDPTQHALATGAANGFMSSSDFTKLAGSTSNNTPSTLMQRSAGGDVRLSTLTLTSPTNIATISPNPTNFGGPDHTIALPIPTTDDSLVLNSVQATLSNKSLVDSSTTIQNLGDPTKLVRFDLSAIATATTRVLTIPDSSTTLVGTDNTSVLTNKTITSTTNNVTANSLRTATGSVDGSASAQPPGAGYVPVTLAGGTTFQWSLASGGTVSSVALATPADLFSISGSPVTSSGTITLSKVSQAASSFYVSPSGSAGFPTFRTMTVADLPTGIPNANLANSSVTINTSGGITGGGVVALGGTLNLVGSGGTVTSITAGTGLTGGTITSSGNIALSVPVSAVNGGTGQTGYVTGDLLYASTATALGRLADVTVGNVLLSGGVGTSPAYGKVGLTSHVTGVLPIANGGTNSSTALVNNRLLRSLGGAMVEAAALANGQLFIGSTGAAPVAANLTAGTGISITNGTGSITISSTGSSTIPQNIPLFTLSRTLSENSNTTISWYTWETARYSSYTTAKIVLSLLVAPSASNTTVSLMSGVTNLSNITLNSGSPLGYTAGSTFDPSTIGAPLDGNPLLTLVVNRNGNPATQAQIAGVVLEIG